MAPSRPAARSQSSSAAPVRHSVDHAAERLGAVLVLDEDFHFVTGLHQPQVERAEVVVLADTEEAHVLPVCRFTEVEGDAVPELEGAFRRT